MMTPVKNRPALMTALTLAALGLGACDDAYWLIAQAKKGGTSSGSGGGAGGQSSCTSEEVLGGAAVCLDVGTWKQNAYFACEKAGLTLGGYVPYEACGTESYRYVKYTCCPPAPPPPPPPTSCTSGTEGSPTSCKEVGTWKSHAYNACVAAGATLTEYAPYEDCGNGNTRYVKYTCCPPAPPPPPAPTSCTSGTEGSPTSCKDAGTWRSYAHEACVAAGATLTNYAPYEDCGNGNTRYVKYTCCPAVPAAKE